MRRFAFSSLVVLLIGACDNPSNPIASHASTAVNAAVVARVDLGTLGGASSSVSGINIHGTVVGSSQTASGETHAFVWTAAGGMVDLGALPGHTSSKATSVTNNGRILGWSGPYGPSGATVVWTAGDPASITVVPIPPPPSRRYTPYDFNQDGAVVGSATYADVNAFFWSESTGWINLTVLAPGYGRAGLAYQINASGLVVGTTLRTDLRPCTDPPYINCARAFVWSLEQGYRDLGTPGDDPNQLVSGSGVNNDGTVVGGVSRPGGPRAYRWTETEGFTLLPGLGAAIAINSPGTVAGVTWDATQGVFHAGVWPLSGGVVDLTPGEASASVARAINEHDEVAGEAIVDGQSHATLWTLGESTDTTTQAVAAAFRLAPTARASAGASSSRCWSDEGALMSARTLVECIMGAPVVGP